MTAALDLPPGWRLTLRGAIYVATGPCRGSSSGLPMRLQGADPVELARLAWQRWPA